MLRKVKTVEYECDVCGAKTRVTATQYEFTLPAAGWSTVQVHDCGMTGYTRMEHRCPRHGEPPKP